jgi:ACDE family multidrug resistance protein
MTTPQSDRSILFILCAIPIVMVLGNSMLIPAFSDIEQVYRISESRVGLLITFFSIPAAIIIPIAGFLADRIGRKKVIVSGLLLYGLGGILSGLVAITNASFTWLLTTRALQGIGAAGTAPIAMVLVSDLFSPEKRSKALGLIEAANGIGKVLSPILGAAIALISWYAMFFLFPLLCLPIAIAVWKFIVEPKEGERPTLDNYCEQIKHIFQHHGRWLFVSFFAGAMTMFTLFGTLFAFANMLEHFPSIIKGLLLAIPLLALCITAYIIGNHLQTKIYKMKQLIIIGLGLLGISLVVVPWITQTILVLFIFAVIGIGAGLVLPCLNTMITSAIRLRERGIITSIYSSIRFFGVALGPPIFGALTELPILLYVGTATLLVFATMLCQMFIHRPQRIHGKEGRSRIFLIKKQLHS